MTDTGSVPPSPIGAISGIVPGEANSQSKAEHPQVLLVGNDAEVCETLSEYLGLHGFHTSSFATLASARRALARREPAPCLFLLDTDTLPNDRLLSFVSHVADDLTAIILVSGGGTQVDHILGIGLPFHAHIMKPLDLRELLAKTKQVFDCLISKKTR